MQLSDDPVLQILPFNAKIRFPVPIRLTKEASCTATSNITPATRF
ncbi:hypothetical protein NEISICOT_00025 [Neisseria sicca ATCC 29256]|uniref:Uncharacterized protein n=1 Tax=Neisseria sicca ATCC 29256 TaxID=547045 RepID=C6M0K0_NEISI|nr:hypothetical protein NEISICOT_00025 [Neisseria sicca ATCC 29256]